MQLNNLGPNPGAKKVRRRVGRGIGSGLGKTAGRGHKGQKSRAGGYHKVGFEGGQMPLQRRLPKRGFKSAAVKFRSEITLSDLNIFSEKGEEVTLEKLKAVGLVKSKIKAVKVVNTGEIKNALKLVALGATVGAKEAIEAAGGSFSAD